MRKPRRQRFSYPFVAPSAPPRATPAAPLVSVVLPIYRHAEYLNSAVQSVLSSPVIAGSGMADLELIVIDDGSPNGAEIAVQLEPFAGDPRFRLMRIPHGGLSAALNTGFSAARGLFFSWTSADNLFKPGALSRLAGFLEQNPAIDLVYANVMLIDERGEPLRRSEYRVPDQGPDSSVLLLPYSPELLLEMPDNFFNSCFMYRRRLHAELGGYDTALPGLEDYGFWLEVIAHGRAAHLDSDDVLYGYRLHPESLTGKLDRFELARRTEAVRAAYAARPIAAAQYFPVAAAPGRQYTVLVSAEPEPFRCPTLARFQAGTGLIRTLNDGTSSGGRRTAVLPPPLRLPLILKRARDSDFGAVQHAAGSRGAVLLFPPANRHIFGAAVRGSQPVRRPLDWTQAAAAMVLGNPQFTFVLLASSEPERAVSDRVNIATGGSSNLRIVDLSAQAAEGHEQFCRSLMYVLSSVDLILSLLPRSPTAAQLLELRVEAGIGALAGVEIAACGAQSIQTTREAVMLLQGAAVPGDSSVETVVRIQDAAQLRCAVSPAVLQSAAAAVIFPIPHFRLVGLKPYASGSAVSAPADFSTAFTEFLAENRQQADYRALDQWLQVNCRIPGKESGASEKGAREISARSAVV